MRQQLTLLQEVSQTELHTFWNHGQQLTRDHSRYPLTLSLTWGFAPFVMRWLMTASYFPINALWREVKPSCINNTCVVNSALPGGVSRIGKKNENHKSNLLYQVSWCQHHCPEACPSGVSAVPAMKWMPFQLHQTIHQELDLASNISEKQLNQCIHLMPHRLRSQFFSSKSRNASS